MDATQLAVDVLAILGVIAAVAAGVRGLVYLSTPYRAIRDRMEEHDQTLKEYEEYFKRDKEAIDKLTELTRDSLKIQLSILNHTIDGNGIVAMQKIRDELQEKL